MKVRDLLKIDAADSAHGKRRSLLRHATKKRKANPQASRTTPMSNFVDVFGGLQNATHNNDAMTMEPGDI